MFQIKCSNIYLFISKYLNTNESVLLFINGIFDGIYKDTCTSWVSLLL